MSGREEAIKYIEESIRDLKQFCKIHQQDDWKKMKEEKYEALVALYATLDLLKEQKENEHNEEKEEE